MLVGDLSLVLLLFVRCFPSVNPTMVNRSDMAYLVILNNVKEILKIKPIFFKFMLISRHVFNLWDSDAKFLPSDLAERKRAFYSNNKFFTICYPFLKLCIRHIFEHFFPR